MRRLLPAWRRIPSTGSTEETPPEWKRRIDKLVTFWEQDDPGFDADVLRSQFLAAGEGLTQGRYLFLTDDSGVGGSHKEPSIPCYQVTRLDHAMERVVASELAGSAALVDPALVLRTVGAPVDGQCALQAGLTATLF